MHFLCRFDGAKPFLKIAFVAVIFLLVSVATGVCANTAPPQPAPAPASEDFGQYLVDHQADLAPFFDKNAEDLVRKAMPSVLGLLAWILMLTFIAGWVIDILIIRGLTPFFAPAYSKIKRAATYSTGRLVLSLLVLGVLALTVFVSTRFVHAGFIILAVFLLLFVVTMVVQVIWLAYMFRMNTGTAVIFFVIILGAQTLTFILVATPILVGKPSALAYGFVNETLTPELQDEVDATKQELAEIQKGSDATRAKIAQTQNQIAQDKAEAEKLMLQIENKKNSEAFRYQQIVKIEATGDLATARDQFNAMLAKYPAGILTESAKTHLAQIESELATQDAQRKQAEADAAAAAAAARADLLARAAKGEVTLSEIRGVLMGKSLADVTALFGPPTDTASNRWGYGQRMIVNPATNQKYGLTVIFVNGLAQSFDYYYGAAPK